MTRAAAVATMRAVVAERFGDPAEVLVLRERPVPEPGPGEVRLRLLLSPIHTHDLELVLGDYGHRPALPLVPGSEAVGLVDALGPGVTGLQPGQRVCVAGASGTWAECFVVPAERVVPAPETLPDEAACQLLAMPLSACLLFDELAVGPGDWIVQNAANGTVGRFVNALAQQRGVQVLNLVRGAEARSALQAAGARHVVSTHDHDWLGAATQATQGAPLVRGIDSLGGEAANTLLGLLAEGGTLVSFGSAVSLTLPLQVEHLLYKQTTVRGFWAARRAATLAPAVRRRLLGQAIERVAAGDVPLTLDAALPFDALTTALQRSARPNRLGKVALRPA